MFTRCIAVLMATLSLAGLACTVAFAAQDNSPVSLELVDADVKSAIASLFQGKHRNFSVSQDVSGVIPRLSISGVPFDQALKSLLKSANLVYRVENDVYMISKKPDTSTVPTLDASAAAPVDDSAVDTTTTVDSVIDKVPLSNTGASEILAIMKGNTNSNQNGYGSMGTNGFGNNSFGGSSFGGSSFGGSRIGCSSFGGSSFGNSSYGGSSRNYGGSSSYGGGGGYRSW